MDGSPFGASRFLRKVRRQGMEFVVRTAKVLEQKALSLLAALERAGKSVTSVAVEGQRIEFMLSSGETVDEFDRIDMRHGKT